MSTSTTPDRALSKRAVIERFGLSSTTLYRLIEKGQFPRQRKIGHRSFWAESEVAAWFESLPRAGK